MNNTDKTQTLYHCPKKLVTVIRKSKGLKRWPKHGYPCAMYILRPKIGTRVRPLGGGSIEYLPSYDELRVLLVAADPRFAKLLPAFMRNKPIARQRFHDHKNAKRHAAK